MNKKVFSLFIAVVLVSSFVFATTVTIRPDGAGYWRGWGNVGCSPGINEWQCVDETPADTGDYLRNFGIAKETFTFDDTGLTDETITNITIYYYAKWYNKVANSCFNAMTRSGSTDYVSGTQMCVGSSWEYVSHEYLINPTTGSAWTVAQVDALEAGMKAVNPNGGGQVAQVFALIDYVPFVCGNDVKEGNEVCDGTDLGGETCVSQGYSGGGDLACNDQCDAFDTSGCYMNSCYDTDGGFIVWVQGTVSGDYMGEPYSYTDECYTNATGSYVLEGYCASGYAWQDYFECGGNYTGCSNGACY